MRSLFIFVLLFLEVAVQSSYGQNLTQLNKETLIESSRILEANPLDKRAPKIRKVSIDWIHNQNIYPHCSFNFQLIMPTSYRFRIELIPAFIIGSAAYILENPEKSRDEDNSSRKAGMESMIKSYEQIIEIKPSAKVAALDRLANLRKNKKLPTITCQNY